MSRSTIARNTAAMMVLQIANYAIPLVNFPYLTRVLGVQQYGNFSLAFALASYGAIVTNWGFPFSASRDVATHHADRAHVSQVFWSTLGAKTLLFALMLALLLVSALFNAYLYSILPVVLAAAGQVAAAAINSQWFLQGMEKLGRYALISTGCQALAIPLVYLLVRGPGDAWLAAAILSLCAVLVALSSFILIARARLITRPKARYFDILGRIKGSTHFFIAGASANLYTTANTVLIGFMLGPYHAGIYAAADRLRAAAQNVIQPLTQACYPRSCKIMAESRRAGFAFARKVMLMQVAITLPVTIVLTGFAYYVIQILAGSKYGDSIDVLRILGLTPLLVGISSVFGVQIMLPLHLQKSFSGIRMIAGFAGMTVSLLLIYPLHEIGAAAGTVAAEVTILLLTWRACKREGFTLIGPIQARAAVTPPGP